MNQPKLYYLNLFPNHQPHKHNIYEVVKDIVLFLHPNQPSWPTPLTPNVGL